jgi:hypothetical protein
VAERKTYKYTNEDHRQAKREAKRLQFPHDQNRFSQGVSPKCKRFILFSFDRKDLSLQKLFFCDKFVIRQFGHARVREMSCIGIKIYQAP